MIVDFARKLRTMAPFAIAAQAMLAVPARAQTVPDNGLSTIDALKHDIAAVADLIHRQLAMPIRSPFGLVELFVVLAIAAVLAWPLRLWLLSRVSTLLRTAPMEHQFAIRTKALVTVIITWVLVSFAGHITLGAVRSSVDTRDSSHNRNGQASTAAMASTTNNSTRPNGDRIGMANCRWMRSATAAISCFSASIVDNPLSGTVCARAGTASIACAAIANGAMVRSLRAKSTIIHIPFAGACRAARAWKQWPGAGLVRYRAARDR